MTDKVSRSLKLERHVDEMLQRICEARGVTCNSFLVNVVGDAIYKADSQYRIEKATVEATEASILKMTELMGGFLKND